MTQASLVTRAKQGDPNAIALLITQSLRSMEVQARAQRQNETTLQVILEGPSVPDRDRVLPILQQGMINLNAASIQVVQVYGRQINQDGTAWTSEFHVSNPPSVGRSDDVLNRALARDTTWAAFCHLTPLVIYVFAASQLLVTWFWLPLGAPMILLPILVPLLVMVIKGPESPFIRSHAQESLNFQITILIYGLFCFLLFLISIPLTLVLVGLLLMPIALLLLVPLGIFELICAILAAIAASNGKLYHYPLCLRLVN